MRKNIAIVICLMGLVGGVGIGASMATFMGTMPVNEKYNDLLGDYNDLLSDYNALLDELGILQVQFDALIGERDSLLTILDAYENPMTNHIIPTKTEVQNWLWYVDDTENAYIFDSSEPDEYIVGEWMCGDFAAMLMTNAREMNWRMRIACMFWSHNGESGWQSTDGYDQYGAHGHAFNLIYCQDGSDPDTDLDIWYIEPQTDRMWYVSIGGIPHIHYQYYKTMTGGLSYTVWATPYWVNHYSSFA